MRAKTILTGLFLISLAVAVIVILRAMPGQVDANTNTPKGEILGATVPRAAGTSLRTTGGASTGLLFPGDRVDVILTQNFKGESAAITRRSVSETVVENLRVLAIDTLDAKAPSGSFGRTVTIEVTPQQAEKINVATELGKLSLTLRSVSGPDGVLATSTAGPGPSTGVKPTWAGDVSPALGGAMPERPITVQQPPVEVVRGSKREAVKSE